MKIPCHHNTSLALLPLWVMDPITINGSVIGPNAKEVAEHTNDILGLTQVDENHWIADIALSEYRSEKGLRNIACAAAITAYSRIHINKYKNIPNNPCFYSDTDSVILQHPLPDFEMGSEIGKMKLEYKIEHGVFIGAKVYGLKLEDGYVVKVKGQTKNATLIEATNKTTTVDLFNVQLQTLTAFKNNKKLTTEFAQSKFIRTLNDPKIITSHTKYSLELVVNKREFYVEDGEVKTRALKIGGGDRNRDNTKP